MLLSVAFRYTEVQCLAQASFTRDFADPLTVRIISANSTLIAVLNEPVYDKVVFFQIALQKANSAIRGPWANLLEGYNVTTSCSDEQYLNDSAAATQDWTCDVCPVGAKCAGNIRYEECAASSATGASLAQNHKSFINVCFLQHVLELPMRRNLASTLILQQDMTAAPT